MRFYNEDGELINSLETPHEQEAREDYEREEHNIILSNTIEQNGN